ncbi:MAG: DciA family protein [Candidatus Caenarcaniphilales bacterium]|nr:DciA family protein [Candidatus Caenarcaniphilales bacterium]
MFFSLNDLVQDWSNRATAESSQIKAIETAWELASRSNAANIGEIKLKEGELVIEVNNHSLMSNLQLDALNIINELNQELSQLMPSLKINKLRFRLNSK